MKIFICILFSFQFIISIGQTNEVRKFQNDLINKQLMTYDGEIRISTLIDSSWMKYHLKRLTDTVMNNFRYMSSSGKDSLNLTKSERYLIITYFRNSENLKLTDNPTNFNIVDTSEVINHLKKNHANQVVYISKPLFIRDGKIGVAFFANLCCGGIYGPVNFSFYRKENTNWTRWIDISSGEF